MQRPATSGLQFDVLTGRFALNSFCGETSFYFLKIVKKKKKHLLIHVKCIQVKFNADYH